MTGCNWFEISNEGWRRLNAGRPLGALMREAVQNAFDAAAKNVRVDVDESTIVIEDDSPNGFDDERLVYTVFLTDKADAPTQRGRKGRGLKELISAARTAVVESVGVTVSFDRDGRRSAVNKRRKGTRLTLQRRNVRREIDAALAFLALVVPPRGVRFQVNSQQIPRPRTFQTIGPYYLQTVVIRDGIERLVERPSTLHLLHPRDSGEPPHIYEMGIPIQPIGLPWHVDIEQRVPLAAGRDRIDEYYRLTVYTSIFEELVPRRLPKNELQSDWVMEVLGQCDVSDAALHHYVRRSLPARAVLSGSKQADDRARQAGMEVVSTRSMARGVLQALGRVVPTSDAYVNARLEAEREPVEPTDQQQLALELYEHLAQRLLGRSVRVRLMRKPANLEGYVDDGLFDRRRGELWLNILGSVDLTRPLSADSLTVVLHELAHNDSEAHDERFIRALDTLAGRAAELLLREGGAFASWWEDKVPG